MRLFYLASLTAGAYASQANFAESLSELICGIDNCQDYCINILGYPTQQCATTCSAVQGAQCNNGSDSLRPRSQSDMETDWWAKMAISSIDSYGCWCYFDDDIYDGEGEAQNGMDELCKQLVKSYYCIELDDDTCDLSTSYTTVHNEAATLIDGGDTAEDAYVSACATANGGDSTACAARICTVEGYFLYSIIDYFFGGSSFDTSLLHSKGSFDPSTECEHTAGTARDSFTCCGTYPLRSRFKVVDAEPKTCCAQHYLLDSGTRDCCDSTSTYNSNTHECCGDGDGTIKEIGSC